MIAVSAGLSISIYEGVHFLSNFKEPDNNNSTNTSTTSFVYNVTGLIGSKIRALW